MDDDFALPSDTEAALELLHAQCPPGATLSGIAVSPLHMLYSVVHDGTDVDHELERLRLSHRVRIVQLATPHGVESIVVRPERFADSLRAFDEIVAGCLARCTGYSVRKDELGAELAVSGTALDEECDRLASAGWLRPMMSATRAGPDELPEEVGQSWLWALPEAGRVIVSLLRCRDEVIKLLWKQKFHRSSRAVLEAAPGVRKALTQTALDFRYVLRDLLGRRLVSCTEHAAAAGRSVLQLTPAGEQAAHASALRTGGRKRKQSG